MHWIARSAPGPDATQLVSLCCSLNSPVVSIPELPVGPASAAIAIHTDADNASHITVAVQCCRTAAVALFRVRGESGEPNRVSARVALLWAEGMGFLFDEELCTDLENQDIQKGVRNETATEIWRALVQGDQPESPDCESSPNPSGPEAAAMLSKFRFHRDARPHGDPGGIGPQRAGVPRNESNPRPCSEAAFGA